MAINNSCMESAKYIFADKSKAPLLIQIICIIISLI